MFVYENQTLCLRQAGTSLPLKNLIEEQKHAFYLYDLNLIKERYRLFFDHLPPRSRVFFSMKSNNCFPVLQSLHQEGSGVDVVSEGEILHAQKAGLQGSEMVFSGVSKTKEEITKAIELPLLQINVESMQELKRIDSLTRLLNKPASLALRLNPNVDFETHPYIKTGLHDHKFGIDEEILPHILEFVREKPLLKIQGLSQHIGSQIRQTDALLQSWSRLKNQWQSLCAEGLALKSLDLGGGLGVDYSKPGFDFENQLLQSYSQCLNEVFKDFPGELWFEPGRFLVAKAGILCMRVEYVKKTKNRCFALVNSGMHHFLRPSLYQSYHRIENVDLKGPKEIYDVAGPICETGDILSRDTSLHQLKEGSLLVLRDAGAYGWVMSNNYNLQPKAMEICFLDGKRFPQKKHLRQKIVR